MIFISCVFELDYPRVIAVDFLAPENSLELKNEIYCRTSYLIQCWCERQRIANNGNSEKMEMPAAPVAEAQAGLTTMSEVAPHVIEMDTTDESLIERFAGPYPSPELQKQIEKVYPVAEFSWQFGDVPFQNKVEIAFPDALLNKAFIAANLEGYMWLRADIEYEVKISGTKFHNGKLNVSHISRGSSLTTAVNNAIKRLNHESSLPLYGSSINSVKGMIRRNAPTAWDRIRGDGFIPHAIGSLFVDVQNPLSALQTGEPTEVLVTVFARFVNSDVKGFGPQASSANLSKLRKLGKLMDESVTKKSGKQKKKDPVANEAEAKSRAGLISGPMEAIGNLSPVLLLTPFPEAAPIAGMIGKFAPFVRSIGLSKPVDLQSTQPVSEVVYNDVVHTHGIARTQKLSCHPEATLAAVKLNEFGLHKVMDITKKPGFLGTIVLDVSKGTNEYLLRFPVTPTLAFLDNESDPANNVFYPTFLAYISQFFSNYNGGMKFLFEFISNEFVSTRARFWHLPCDHATTTPEEFAGSAVTEIEDIRGNTIVALTYAKDDRDVGEAIGGYTSIFSSDADMALAIPSLERHPFLAMDLVSKVTVPEPGNISTIYVNVYAAGAEDSELLNYQAFNLRRPSVPLATSSSLRSNYKKAESSNKKSLFTRFEKPFRPIGQAKGFLEAGLISNEHVGTVENLCKRFEKMVLPQGPYFAGNGGILFRNGESRTLRSWAELFMWWRGSLRYKLITSDFPSHSIVHFPFWPYNEAGEPNGDPEIFPGYNVESTLYATGSIVQTANVEILWDSTQYAAYCDPAQANLNDDSPSRTSMTYFTPVGDTPPGIIKGFWAVGEDFQFGQLLTPPIAVWEVPPPLAKERSEVTADVASNKGKKKA